MNKTAFLALCFNLSFLTSALGAESGTTSKDSMMGRSGNSAMGEMNSSMMEMHSQMQGVESTGNPDVDFMKMMIPHHQGAINMSKQYLKFGKNKSVRARAEKIIRDQQREIEEMKTAINEELASNKKKNAQ